MEGYQRIIEAKKPVYLVLRDSEWDRISGRVRSDYALVVEFPSAGWGPGYVIVMKK